MPQVERSALVPYSREQMFQLVNDVACYPQFVPSCEAAEVLEQNEHFVVGRLFIKKAGIQQAFTTKNTLYPYDKVTLELVDGPFKHLSGLWAFKALPGNACRVSLQLEFEFSNRMLQFAFGKVFNEVTSKMVDAFAQRAKQVYGAYEFD